MDLHARFKKLNDDMLQLSEEVFRAVRISPTKFAICFFDRATQELRTSVIDSSNAHELKLISELSGNELISYGTFRKQIEDWCEQETGTDFPIPVRSEDLASYRTLMDATLVTS